MEWREIDSEGMAYPPVSPWFCMVVNEEWASLPVRGFRLFEVFINFHCQVEFRIVCDKSLAEQVSSEMVDLKVMAREWYSAKGIVKSNLCLFNNTY